MNSGKNALEGKVDIGKPTASLYTVKELEMKLKI